MEQRVALYCRVSTQNDDQANSISTQQSLLINYCMEHGLVYDLYIDHGFSGTSIQRPKFLELMEKCSLVYVPKYDILTIDRTKEVQYKTILVKNTSRLGRDMYLLQILNMLKKVGVIVEYLEDGKSTATMDNAMDSFMIGLSTLLDRNFSEANSKKVITGMQQGAKKGNLNFAKIFGYDKVGDHLIINKQESKIVQNIFNMYTEEGKGFRRIAQELNEAGYRSKNNKPFSHNSIADIIAQSKYYGNLTRNKQARSKLLKQKSVTLRPEDEWIQHNYGDIVNGQKWTKIPPLITKEQWLKAQQIRNNRAGETRGIWKGIGEWAGKIHCKCGNNYVRNSYKDHHGKTHTYLVCYLKKTKGLKACNSINLSEDKILNLVTQDYLNGLVLRQKLTQIQGITHKIRALHENISSYSQLDLDTVQQKLYKVKQRKQVLLDRLLDNTIDNTTYKNKAGELDEEISKLNNTIKEITNNYNTINNKINQLQQKKKQVAQIKINKTYSKEQIIEAIKNIYVDGNKLEIHIDINGVLFKDTLYI